jgi:ribosomal protein L29
MSLKLIAELNQLKAELAALRAEVREMQKPVPPPPVKTSPRKQLNG